MVKAHVFSAQKTAEKLGVFKLVGRRAAAAPRRQAAATESRAVDGLAFLRGSKIGLTNRPHARILMTLMHVPHGVTNTVYDKVKGFYS